MSVRDWHNRTIVLAKFEIDNWNLGPWLGVWLDTCKCFLRNENISNNWRRGVHMGSKVLSNASIWAIVGWLLPAVPPVRC